MKIAAIFIVIAVPSNIGVNDRCTTFETHRVQRDLNFSEIGCQPAKDSPFIKTVNFRKWLCLWKDELLCASYFHLHCFTIVLLADTLRFEWCAKLKWVRKLTVWLTDCNRVRARERAIQCNSANVCLQKMSMNSKTFDHFRRISYQL